MIQAQRLSKYHQTELQLETRQRNQQEELESALLALFCRIITKHQLSKPFKYETDAEDYRFRIQLPNPS